MNNLSDSNYLVLLLVYILFNFIIALYEKYLRPLEVIKYEWVITSDQIVNSEINFDLDLNDSDHLNLYHPKPKTPFDYHSLQSILAHHIITNPIVHINLPISVFPNEKDMIGFEYQLETIDKLSLKTYYQKLIIQIELYDAII